MELSENQKAVVINALRNVWNLGGIVALAFLGGQSQDKLAELAEANAIAEIERALSS